MSLPKNRKWSPTTPKDTYAYRLFKVYLYRTVPRIIAQNIEYFCKKNYTLFSLCMSQIRSPRALKERILLLIHRLTRELYIVKNSKTSCRIKCLISENCPHIQIVMWPILNFMIREFHMNVALYPRLNRRG